MVKPARRGEGGRAGEECRAARERSGRQHSDKRRMDRRDHVYRGNGRGGDGRGLILSGAGETQVILMVPYFPGTNLEAVLNSRIRF